MNIEVVSLFSGGGGLDLGFIAEGYKIIWAIDNNKNATDTYRANIGNHIICEDINKIDINNIPHADVVIGGPPCQSFSLAGKRNVVFENVTGLLSAKNSQGEKIIELLKIAFENIGYTIEQQVMNAADYGIPQRRKRVIIVGLKNANFIFPKPTHCEDGIGLKQYVSVEDALADLPEAIRDEDGVVNYTIPAQNEFQQYVRRNVPITEHFIPQMSELDKYIVNHVKPGGNYMDIPADVKSNRIRRLQREGGHTTCYGRLRPDKPSYTINTYFNRPNVGCNIHYKKNRLITVREALRLQSFPDDYKIISSSKQGRNLIVGNAVPPLLAAVIAHQLKIFIQED